MQPELSVVIPTHRRPKILLRCLEHLEKQTASERLEAIVVSDGADVETAAAVASRPWKIPVRYFEIPKSQQGAARNRGVREALGERILFIGDDIFLHQKACDFHISPVAALGPLPQLPLAVLGFTTWDPALEITRVMRWLEETGWQFGYPAIREYAHDCVPASMQHRFTYTSHVSVPATVARHVPFREDVTMYGWEDIEWGWRLKEKGVALFYEPDAKAAHHHRVTLKDSLKRMETLGRSAVAMDRIAPQLRLVPRGIKLWKYRVASLLPGLRGLHARAFLRGCLNM